MTLEQLQPKAAMRGMVPDDLVSDASVLWFGPEARELTWKTSSTKPENFLLHRHHEPRLEGAEPAGRRIMTIHEFADALNVTGRPASQALMGAESSGI